MVACAKDNIKDTILNRRFYDHKDTILNRRFYDHLDASAFIGISSFHLELDTTLCFDT
jgi:hypothetical protein